ncbi:MAG: hypothetical protein IJU93_00800 [Lachnospiraceae bacterium]|nr:hypothetical protein [Lachnospiraceae bacterium]
MDKYEYKVRSAQIKSLIENGEYQEAVQIADSIDWSRVPSVSRLLTISELYMVNKRYEESKEILLLAKERHPNGRSIIYRLCEICIKLNEIGEAVAYLGQYDQRAADPAGSLILRYKILLSQGSSLEERIKVLEDLKAEDYQEKWGYELASLYSEAGNVDKCISECNELITWFGPDGKYGQKALNLKERYEIIRSSTFGAEKSNENAPGGEAVFDTSSIPIQVMSVDASDQPTQKIPNRDINSNVYGENDFLVQPVNLDKNATLNLQEELKRNMDELASSTGEPLREVETPIHSLNPDDPYAYYQSRGFDVQSVPVADEDMTELHSEGYVQQAQDVYPEQQAAGEQGYYPEQQAAGEQGYYPEQQAIGEQGYYPEQQAVEEQAYYPGLQTSAPKYDGALYGFTGSMAVPGGMKNMVSEEYDGQMVLNVPESPSETEKQITGQMDFQDILDGWEKRTEESNRKRVEGAKRKSLEQTNDIVNQLKGVIPGIVVHDDPNEIGVKPRPEETLHTAEERKKPVHTPPVKRMRAALEEIEDDSSAFALDAEGMRMASEKEGKVIAGDTLNMLSDEEFDDAGSEGYEEEYYPENDYEYTGDGGYAPDEYSGDYDTDYGNEGEYADDDYPEQDEYAEDEYYAEEEYVGEEEYSPEEGYGGEEYPEEEGYTDEEGYSAEEGYQAEDYGDEYGYEDAGQDYPQDEEAEYTEEASGEYQGEYQDPSSVPPVPDRSGAGDLTEEEQEIFKDFLLMHDLPGIIRDALSRIGMEGTCGNVIITGNEHSARINFCGALAKDLQLTHPDFIGKIAKISAEVFNKKDISRSIAMLDGGALVIENAAELTNQTLQEIVRVLNQPEIRILMMLEDNHFYQKRVGENIPGFAEVFNVHINIPAYTNDDLVFHGREYARQKEYAIDNMGVLALYRRVDQLQTANHFVTLNEVEDIVDEAIEHVDKRSVGHFMDVLLAKRYDDEDMIILREKDFDVRKKEKK